MAAQMLHTAVTRCALFCASQFEILLAPCLRVFCQLVLLSCCHAGSIAPPLHMCMSASLPVSSNALLFVNVRPLERNLWWPRLHLGRTWTQLLAPLPIIGEPPIIGQLLALPE